MQITTVGLDLAKLVFQVHGVDAQGRTVLTKKLKREQLTAFFAQLPPCLVGMEACSSAHHWARVQECPHRLGPDDPKPGVQPQSSIGLRKILTALPGNPTSRLLCDLRSNGWIGQTETRKTRLRRGTRQCELTMGSGSANSIRGQGATHPKPGCTVAICSAG